MQIESTPNIDPNRQSVIEIIASDLTKSLAQFNDPKKGLRVISRKTGLHEKTLNRILAKETKPSYQTVFKIYKYLFQTENDNKVLELVNPAIKDLLVRSNPQPIESNIDYSNYVDNLLIKNIVWGEIYLLASTGMITLDEVKESTGKMGIRALQEMLNEKILSEPQQGRYTLGEKRASFSPELILKLGTHLVTNYTKISNGDVINQNFQGLYIEGINHETYQQWLQIDMDAFYKKIELANNIQNHGDYKAFTFMTTDTMNHNLIF